nr:hypothetical protein [uncultured Bdellovibrio sp.]
MRLLISSFFILLLLISLDSLAAPSAKIKKLVDGYYSQKTVWSKLLGTAPRPRPLPDPPDSNNPPLPERPPNRPPNCPPTHFPTDCIEAVCQQMSRFECDDRDDMIEVTQACRNVDGSCVRTVCSHVSRFACDEKVEIFEVTDMCRGLIDSSCIDYVCSRISKFECDEISEIREIAEQCR